MPSALYAISYKPTSSVIALCRLEQQTLVDQAAWDRLLATLVGPRLPISMTTSDPAIELALAATELGCDLVTDLSPLDLEPVLAAPFQYRVVANAAGATVPGDGTPKRLERALTHKVSSITLTPGSEGARPKVTVLMGDEVDVAGARLVFEGRPPVASEPPPAGHPRSQQIAFLLPAGIAIDRERSYAVMFLMEDTPVEARLLRSSQGLEGVQPGVRPTPPPAPVTPGGSTTTTSDRSTTRVTSGPVTPAPGHS